MGTLIKAMYNNWWFYTLTAIAIILLVASWFVPPTGATDAYNKGDKVTYNGKHWASTADANVWQPGVYGWDEMI